MISPAKNVKTHVIYPVEMNTYIYKKTRTRMFKVALSVIAENC